MPRKTSAVSSFTRRHFLQTLPVLAATPTLCLSSIRAAPSQTSFVRVSRKDKRYFELSDGTPYTPIGLNMIAPPGNEGFPGMLEWMRKLAGFGGNFIRIWASADFFDVEHVKSGEYDESRAERLAQLFAAARPLGIKVKVCLEHFRHLGEGTQKWAGKPLHHISNGGTATNMVEFMNNAASRDRFKQKLRWLSKKFRDEPAVFGWELWNEVNAVVGGDYLGWTEAMLPELRHLFPNHLVMQSLGSYDSDYANKSYTRLPIMQGNEVAQVHRYLDLGAAYPICHGPMDVLAADAVRQLVKQKPGKPVLLAEGGAVEPNHTGPFKLYQKDSEGMLLHDVLFAAYFAGAAGPGHIWHWDAYVGKLNLWWQFGRFAEAVKGINAPEERFEPSFKEDGFLRLYILKGQKTTIVWCRDSRNTWQTELGQGQAPEVIQGPVLDIEGLLAANPPGSDPALSFYDPWKNQHGSIRMLNGKIALPTFKRSIVLRLA